MLGHRQTQVNFKTAEALAADLAGAEVDVNEAQKVLAYVRNKKKKEALFSYLNAVVEDGYVVIRSGRTMDYYRNLQRACKHHLDDLEYDELLQTLGWSLRLLRYYRQVPEAAPKRTVRSTSPVTRPPGPGRPRQPQRPRQPEPATQPVPVRDTPPPSSRPQKKLPAVGEEFTGTVLDADQSAVLVQVPGFNEATTIALLTVEADTPKYKPGNSAKVRVVGVDVSGKRTIVKVERAKKKK